MGSYKDLWPINLDDLTEDERKVVLNGCGAKGVKVPHFGYFCDACNEHDLRYWQGGDERKRALADALFLADMREAASRAAWWKRGALYGAAWLYYRAVKKAGMFVFPYGTSRTRADLKAAARKLRWSQR